MVTFKVKSFESFYNFIHFFLQLKPQCKIYYQWSFSPWKIGSSSLLPILFLNYILQILKVQKISLTITISMCQAPPTVLRAWLITPLGGSIAILVLCVFWKVFVIFFFFLWETGSERLTQDHIVNNCVEIKIGIQFCLIKIFVLFSMFYQHVFLFLFLFFGGVGEW